MADDSLAAGIGRRLDGWAARDLDVGAIIALAPDLSPLITLLGAQANIPAERQRVPPAAPLPNAASGSGAPAHSVSNFGGRR